MDDSLYTSLCSTDILYSAWLRVKEKNTTGGVDKQTVQEYSVAVDRNIEKLINQLQTGSYIQQPYREVYIPKSDTEKRRLGLLTINDKIVQTAVTILVQPIIEKGFLNVSYAYRNNKGPVKAINQVKHLITNERYCWLVSCDIDDFFDSIPHEPLFGKLSSYLKSPGITELIRMFVTMGRVNSHHQWKDSRKGIPQGGVISPLLANFYLYPLDKLMVDNGYGFVRYADDFIILGRTEEEAIKAMNQAIEIITHQLGLSLNEGYTVVPVSNGFEFLGILFTDGQISLSEKKYKRLVEKMYDAAGMGKELISQKLKETFQGISNFYGKLVPQDILCKLDNELVAILRLRSEALTPGKVKKGTMLTQLQSLQFLSDANNAKKTEYILTQLGQLSGESDKKKKKLKGKQKLLKSKNAVLKRKHEYKKLESSGFDLAVAQPGLVLGIRENTATVRKNGLVINEIPLLNLKSITVMSEGVSFSSNLVKSCTEQKISINFLRNDGMPYAQIISPSYFDAQIGVAQLEAYNNGKGVSLIRGFVYGKINNQANLVKYYGKYYLKRNPKFREAFPAFLSNMGKFNKLAHKMPHDNVDEFRLKMFAIEGNASSCYWEIIAILLGPKITFVGRERQGAKDLVNCMLNYGYGILYARISEALIHSRLNPCLSYLHKPEGNRPSLVYDLIEEFRQQAVDRVIFSLLVKNINLKAENGVLNYYTRKLVAEKVIDRINNVEIFRNKEARLSEIFQIQARAIVKYLVGDIKYYKPYMPKW